MKLVLSVRDQFIALVTMTLITILCVNLSQAWPILGRMALPGLLFMPGFLLMNIIRPRNLKLHEWILNSVGLSVLSLMATGLVINQLLPVFHIARPLDIAPAAGGVAAMLFAFLSLAALRLKKKTLRIKNPLSLKTFWIGASFMLLPIISALGALRLNNGGSNILTMIMLGTIAVLTPLMVLMRKHLPNSVWPWALFNMALALLWSTSLRGWFITGHDVQLEYYVFRLTDMAGQWSMSHLRDPYNACLSITILPVLLKSVTGVSGIMLYKVVYQVVFAVLSTGVYALARRYATPAIAFIATFIFISFPTFWQDMPMLNRQEVAFGFFILLLLALFNVKLSGLTRRLLFVLFGLGMVLSHYSTTFVSLALLGGTYTLLIPYRIILARRAKQLFVVNRQSFGITVGAILVVMFGTAFWTGAYTKTGNSIVHTLTAAVQSVPKLIHRQAVVVDTSKTVDLTKATPQQELDAYIDLQYTQNKTIAQSAGGFYPNAPADLKVMPETKTPLTNIGKWLSAHKLSVNKLIDLAKQGYTLGLEALIVCGAGLMFYYRRAYKRKYRQQYDLLVLAPVAIGLLALQVIDPVIDYGVLRMLQQDLIFMALPVTLAALQLLKWARLRSESHRLVLVAIIFAVLGLFINGFATVITGGAPAQLQLADDGFYYDAYYTNSADIGTYGWLVANFPKGYPIYADMFTRMKIMSQTGITTREGVTPTQLPKESYVVLENSNVTKDQVYQYYAGNLFLIDYRSSTDFLNANKDLIYSTSQSRVYR